MANDTHLLDGNPWTDDGDPAATATAYGGGFAESERAATTPLVARGAARFLRTLGFAVVTELILSSGRRADLVALGPKGEIWIVEVKSGIEDFRADRKWPDYRLYCDRLLFAVSPTFPVDLLPADTGLLISDAYGASLIREAPLHPITGARRKTMLIRFGQAAALRLHAIQDPDLLGFL